MDSAVEQLNDRRLAARSAAPEHDVAFARVRPGHVVVVIDISSVGALLETGRRLLPGTVIELQIQRHVARLSLRARVVRCAVAAIGASGICYHAGVRFECPLSWFTLSPHAEITVPDNTGQAFPV